QFDRVGVFTYSREENTGAFDMPDQTPEQTKKARRAELMELQAKISFEKNRSLIGREVEVIVEGPQPEGARRRIQGRIAGQAPDIDGAVFVRGGAPSGEFIKARIERAMTYDFHALMTEIAN
ncbi:MAG: 30S ribosomal protein S12 methylthiotransferase RimO, partial [Candidatus Binataceae bacterium]